MAKLDEDQVIRLTTPLRYAEFYLMMYVRHPIVLPRKHWVTKLVVMKRETTIQEHTKHCQSMRKLWTGRENVLLVREEKQSKLRPVHRDFKRGGSSLA